MSKIFSRIAGFFSIRTPAGKSRSKRDGLCLEASKILRLYPAVSQLEWMCWLNGQRKRPPTLEEMSELEARRVRVRLNVERLKEEEEKKLKDGSIRLVAATVGGPDLKSFIRQFPGSSEGEIGRDTSDVPDNLRKPEEQKPESNMPE